MSVGMRAWDWAEAANQTSFGPSIDKLKVSYAEKAALAWARSAYWPRWKKRLRRLKEELPIHAQALYERPFGYDYLNDNINVARMALDKVEGRRVRDLPVVEPPKEK